MPLLNGVLALHDIRDTERLARQAIRDARGPRPDTPAHDDLLADIIDETYEVSLRYDPQRRRAKFTSIAYRIAYYRTVDEVRRYPGNARPGRRPAPELLSLEHAFDSNSGDEQLAGSHRDPLGNALTASTGDPANDRSPDLLRALLPRDRHQPRSQHEDDRPPARRAA